MANMPRAPKSCKKRGCEEMPEAQKAAKQADSIPNLVDSLAHSCHSWAAKGQTVSTLPLEAIQKLSHSIWEDKLSSWKGQQKGKDLGSVAEMDRALAKVFRALERACITPADLKSRCKASQAKLQNNAAGCVLAATVLDLSAFRRPRREACDLPPWRVQCPSCGSRLASLCQPCSKEKLQMPQPFAVVLPAQSGAYIIF